MILTSFYATWDLAGQKMTRSYDGGLVCFLRYILHDVIKL